MSSTKNKELSKQNKKEIVTHTTNSHRSKTTTSDNFNAYKDLITRGRHIGLIIAAERHIATISYFDKKSNDST